jgi:ABC-type branched-subunit amino acid transport system ATPase component
MAGAEPSVEKDSAASATPTPAPKAPAPKAPAPAAPSQKTAAIRIRGLTKMYGEFTAVDKLDLTVRHGEVFGLLGPNGAGKTTTILMLLGLSEPTSGGSRVLDLDPTRNPIAVKRHVGYLPDNVGFYGGMTGREPALHGEAQRHRQEDCRRPNRRAAGTRRHDQCSGYGRRQVLARHAPAPRPGRRAG